MFNDCVRILFNTLKIKYVDMDLYFSQIKTNREKIFYFYIDIEYLFKKYLYEIDYYSDESKLNEDCAKEFLVELLNLIAHYKQYFYTRCDAQSFFYIGIRDSISCSRSAIKFYEKIISIISLIPKIYIFGYKDKNHHFYFKYNLTRHITMIKSSQYLPIFIDMCKGYNNELFYTINKNYNLLKYDNRKISLYGFNDFKEEYLSDIDNKYINSVIAMMPVYEVLNEIKINNKVKVDDVILKFVKTHENCDFNKLEVQLLVISLFTELKYLGNKLMRLHENLHSKTYTEILKTTVNIWKNTIKDNKIYNINEILELPEEKRIKIDILMKY